MDKGTAISTLKEKMQSITPLPDEPEFAVNDETIVRFLKGCEWKIKAAEKALATTVEYRRQTRPLTLDCQWCHDRPGFHSMRQVGHDESGRPVVYANFGQASIRKNSVEDIVTHVTYLIENAKVTMEPGVSTWVFVIDCSGMTLSACNPKLGYGVTNILANHYPERLGMVICVNHSSLFHGVWKALKKLMSPGTVAKVKLVRSETKIQQLFSNYFSEELSSWLMEEISRNRNKPIPLSQREFWNPPEQLADHDPRGSPSYVQQFILPVLNQELTFKLGQKKPHCPHPNVIDALRSKVVSLPPQDLVEEAGDTFEETQMAGLDYGVDESNFDNEVTTSEDESSETEAVSKSQGENKKKTKVEAKHLISR